MSDNSSWLAPIVGIVGILTFSALAAYAIVSHNDKREDLAYARAQAAECECPEEVMEDHITIVEEHGQRKLVAAEDRRTPAGPISMRILTEEAINDMHDKDFLAYRQKFRCIRRRKHEYPNLTDPITITTLDYLKHAIERSVESRLSGDE